MIFNFKPLVNGQPASYSYEFDYKDIKGPIKLNISITRSFSGLSLPIRCFDTEYGPLGSCKYDNFCAHPLFRMVYCFSDCLSLFGSPTPNCAKCENSTECNIDKFQNGVLDGKFNVNLNYLQLPSFAYIFLNGIYNVKLQVSDINGEIDCFTVKYGIVSN